MMPNMILGGDNLIKPLDEKMDTQWPLRHHCLLEISKPNAPKLLGLGEAAESRSHCLRCDAAKSNPRL